MSLVDSRKHIKGHPWPAFTYSAYTLTHSITRHQAYFIKHHPLIPIVHPGRYIQAFYSAPHLRPPMALQYAIWTMAANGHEKFSSYHDAFHRRCRHYLQEDEMRVRTAATHSYTPLHPPPRP